MKKNDKPLSAESQSLLLWAKDTALFKKWEAMKTDVEKHKWYESEKAGHDIGWDRAYTDWIVRIKPPPKDNPPHSNSGGKPT